MPIVASRATEIRRLLNDLADSKRRAGAALRLKSMGARIVPHITEELGSLDPAARQALAEALDGVDTADARAVKKRLARTEAESGAADAARATKPSVSSTADGGLSLALETLRALPPPRPSERASTSRERGEAHLALARAGSLLARKELLATLNTLDAGRTRLYCEAAGLIGDVEFLAPLARLSTERPEASSAMSAIASRAKITARSKGLKALPEAVRIALAKALVG